MPRPVYRQRWAWTGGMHASSQETIPGVGSANLALSSLADLGLLTTRQLADFQDTTGLADFSWRLVWSQDALKDAGNDFRFLLRRTHGFVIFMHGWSGKGDMWEQLPDLICAANSRLVALVPDLNGFGDSPFLAEVPAVEHCDPHAIMQAVTGWIDILGLRSDVRAQQRRKVITFVGHSMSGAALFYLKEQDWHEYEFARCAVAPALLINNSLRVSFYQALGVDAWASKPIENLKSQITPQVVKRLTGVVSQEIDDAHLHVSEIAPRGTLTQTLYAMGATFKSLAIQNWHSFRVILAHDDRLMNVSQMLDVLDKLGLTTNQIRVVRGDHYLFSSSDENRQLHLQNREVVLGEILYLHEVCRENQRL